MQAEHILIVDDTPANIKILNDGLKDKYKISAATNGEKALQIVFAENKPDLVLLDIMMPGMDGYEVCKRMKEKQESRNIPVIFITSMGEVEDETKGLAYGAIDYIVKPISLPIVKARVRNHLELKKHRDELEKLVRKRTSDLSLTQEATIEGMATLAEYRDPETGGHIQRTQNYVRLLGDYLAKIKKYAKLLTNDIIHMLFISAPLHDIGKVGVPDNILLKPGKLTEAEFAEMKKHSFYGYNVIKTIEKRKNLGEHSFLFYAAEIAYSHHEKWDGTGYPRQLKGEDISLWGRMMALADVYDALISKRVYKPPFSHEKSVNIIKEGKGSHFDPVIVDAFLVLEKEFRKTAILYADFDEERKNLA